MQEKLKYYAQLVRLDRPIGNYLILWPTLWALWIAAEGIPDIKILLIFVAGVFLMRGAGCAINDYADRHIDKHVARTKDRPLTSGKITEKRSFGVFTVLCLIAFILVLQLNLTTILLSTGAVILAATYPFMKRYHHLPQVHLGAAFGWAIPMSFTAITGEAPPLVAWLMFFTTLLWTTAYDTMYAITDKEDDLKIGVKSSAIFFGDYDKIIIGILQVLTLILLVVIGLLSARGSLYYLGVLAGAVLFLYQQNLIKDRDPQQSFQAFLNNNWFGLLVFVGIFVDYFFA